MGKLQTFEIRLDNRSGVYFAGKVISGNVYVKCSSPVNTRGIKLNISGQGQVHFTQGRSRSICSSFEGYFNVSFVLLGDSSGNSRQTLQSGEHNFPFSFLLPTQLPSSFEGIHGNVRYLCYAEIDLPWKFNSKHKLPFTVNALYDLNLLPEITVPVRQSAEKTIRGWLCKPGTISATVRLPRMGYVPGEAISINAEISNDSTAVVVKTKALLRVFTAFYADSTDLFSVPSRSRNDYAQYHYKELVKIRRGRIEPGCCDIWDGVELFIPPVPPTNLGNCRIIDVQYCLEVVIVLNGFHSPLSLKLPIVIGTVPLRSHFNNYEAYVPHESVQCEWNVSVSEPTEPCGSFETPPSYNDTMQYLPSAPLLPDYPDLPPPSYVQTTFAADNRHEHTENNQMLNEPYKPTYPCYTAKR